MSDLTTKVLVEIRDELRTHGDELKAHGERLDNLENTVAQHGTLLEQLVQQGAANGLTLRQLLGAVEYGNNQRDVRVGDIEARVTRIEEHLDLPLEG